MAIHSISASRRMPFNLTLATALVSVLSNTTYAFEMQAGYPDLSLGLDTFLRANK